MKLFFFSDAKYCESMLQLSNDVSPIDILSVSIDRPNETQLSKYLQVLNCDFVLKLDI